MKFGLGGAFGNQSPYGADAGTFDETFCAAAIDRLLVQDREGPNIRAWVCDLVERWGIVANVANEIEEAFDLDTAIGDRLDKIGARVYLPRLGWDDDRYRTLLKIQILLVQDSTGSGPNLIAITREFVGVGPTIVYDEPGYPAFFTIETLLAPEDATDFLPFIRRAKLGGVGFHVYANPANVLLGDDTQTAVASPGVADDTQTPIVGAAVTAVTYE